MRLHVRDKRRMFGAVQEDLHEADDARLMYTLLAATYYLPVFAVIVGYNEQADNAVQHGGCQRRRRFARQLPLGAAPGAPIAC
jgi:hypothetical protein